MKSSNKATSDNRAYLALANAFVQIYSLQFQTSDMLKSLYAISAINFYQNLEKIE